MIQTISATLSGVSILIVHNERLANPYDPKTRALKELTARNRGKNKTDELGHQIARAEWEGAIYLSADGRPCIPADNIVSCLKEAGRKLKLGKQISAGVFAQAPDFPLRYDGPATIDGLWEDGRFFDYRGVGVQGKRIMRARPKWQQWSLDIELLLDDELVSLDTFRQILHIAGTQIGLGEKRPQYGRFAITEFSAQEQVEAAQ